MLPSLAVGFVVGLVLGSFVPYFPLSVSGLLVLASISVCLSERRWHTSILETTVLFGFVLFGMLYWSVAVERPARHVTFNPESDVPEEITGRIMAPVQQASDRLTALVLRDGPPTAGDQPYRIRLTWRSPDQELFHGDHVRFRAKLRSPSGSRNPGGFDYAAYLERQGISAIASVTGDHGIERLESGQNDLRWAVWNQLDRWRGSIRSAAVQGLSQPALGMYLGVIIGDRGYIDADLREQFMVSGTVHLLSISGSHLGLVAILTFVSVRRVLLWLPAGWLTWLSRRIVPTRVAALATVVPVTIYACLAGAELATMRSLLMVLVALLARWLGYEQRIFHALGAAAMVMVLHDPQAVYDISFQLSFLSVCAIAAWLSWPVTSPSEQTEEPTLIRTAISWGRDAVVMSGVVTLATLPLVAWYFNQVPWLGLFVNMGAVPVMGLVVVPLGLVAGVWHLVSGGTILPLAPLLQWLMNVFVGGINVVAALPGAEWHVASPSIPLMLLFYAFLWTIWRRSGPSTLRWCVGVGMMAILTWWVWSPRLLDGDRFRVTFLDVAQGDSAVLELPNSQVVLIDGGAAYERFDMGRGVVAPYLWNRGIRSIDHVIATHPQLDHVGGLTWVLKHFPVRHYWGPGDTRDEIFYDSLKQAVASRGLLEQVAQAGEEILSSGDCRLSVLNPPAGAVQPSKVSFRRREGHGLNNRSVVTQMVCGSHEFLFTADIEADAIARMKDASHRQPIAVLKVPHHGAVSSLNREWIASLRPRYAVISVGRHNPYGHPAASVIQAYLDQGTLLYRTDRDGGIWITGEGSEQSLIVHRTRERKLASIDFPACVWDCERANWSRLWRQWEDRAS